MADQVNYALKLGVEEGWSTEIIDHIDAEAFQKIEVVIPPASEVTTVLIQPGSNAHLAAIMIISDNYSELTFTVDAEVVVKTLDKPMLLLGSQIDFLGATCNELVFTNAGALVPANVTILTARQATTS